MTERGRGFAESSIRLVVAITLGDAIEDFLLDRRTRRLSERTLQFYQAELGLFARWMPSRGMECHLDAVGTGDLRSWLLELAERRNPGGVHANYRALRAFFRWAWDEYEYTTRNPMAKVAPPKVPEELLEPVSMQTVRALMGTCDTTLLGRRDKAMIIGLLDTGCRASEFVALNVCDVDMKTGAVRVRSGKGGKERMVVIGRRAKSAIARYFKSWDEQAGKGLYESDPLWMTVRRSRLTYRGLATMIRSRAAKAKVPAPSLHSFRRAFAIEMLRNGTNMYALQRLMGHSSLEILRRYLNLAEHDLQEAHRRGSPGDKSL